LHLFSHTLSSTQRLVKEISYEVSGKDYRYEKGALLCLQEVTEAFTSCIFEDAMRVAIHCKRVTVMPSDLVLACKIRGHDTVSSEPERKRLRQ
jgi:histone H3